jgi:hypothetical protein
MGKNGKAPVYQVRIQSQLDRSWSAWLGGSTISPQPDGQTVLYVSAEDQAALWSLLGKLWDLGLPLLSVQCIDDTTGTEGAAQKTIDVTGQRKEVH